MSGIERRVQEIKIADYTVFPLKKNLEQFLAKDKYLTKQKKRDGAVLVNPVCIIDLLLLIVRCLISTH